MTTLAPKLPYNHAFAGGYPRLGGQPLPTDPDAIDYLARVAAADGAAVEVGVAMAVDAFVKGCKADGIWSALKASCILCGARTISGALVPLVGTAPTPYNFASGDYSRTTGLKGDGSTKYLDSNRANNADGQDDVHQSVYVTQASSGGMIGVRTDDGEAVFRGTHIFSNPTSEVSRARSTSFHTHSSATGTSLGLSAISRSNSSAFQHRSNAVTDTVSISSIIPLATSVRVFGRGHDLVQNLFDGRLAFYSIGSAIPDLAALDNRVTTLVAAIAAAL